MKKLLVIAVIGLLLIFITCSAVSAQEPDERPGETERYTAIIRKGWGGDLDDETVTLFEGASYEGEYIHVADDFGISPGEMWERLQSVTITMVNEAYTDYGIVEQYDDYLAGQGFLFGWTTEFSGHELEATRNYDPGTGDDRGVISRVDNRVAYLATSCVNDDDLYIHADVLKPAVDWETLVIEIEFYKGHALYLQEIADGIAGVDIEEFIVDHEENEITVILTNEKELTYSSEYSQIWQLGYEAEFGIDWVYSILGAFTMIFGIELLPNITIGAIVGVLVIIPLAIGAIKLFRGGG